MRKVLPIVSLVLAVALFSSFAFIPISSAYGMENWQIGLAGTGTAPSTGFGFGFWGWCAFAGVSSGTDGDCVVSNYVHSSFFSLTCTFTVDVTGWTTEPGLFPSDFIFNSGTLSALPPGSLPLCLAVAGLSSSQVDPTTGAILVPLDLGIPAIAGHYNLGVTGFGPGLVGEYQIQVTQVP